jgi:hypothetical protein
MRGFFYALPELPGKRLPITWQQKRQRLAQQERLGQQKRQQLVQRQQVLERQEQRLLLFCRKRTEQQQR